MPERLGLSSSKTTHERPSHPNQHNTRAGATLENILRQPRQGWVSTVSSADRIHYPPQRNRPSHHNGWWRRSQLLWVKLGAGIAGEVVEQHIHYRTFIGPHIYNTTPFPVTDARLSRIRKLHIISSRSSRRRNSNRPLNSCRFQPLARIMRLMAETLGAAGFASSRFPVSRRNFTPTRLACKIQQERSSNMSSMGIRTKKGHCVGALRR